jgi:polyhydroxyalkanoate synthesis regulator phasin
MNDDTIQDLKQFITATISQVTAQQTSELKDEISSLDKKIDDRTEEILSAVGDSTNDRFDIVEEDISKLDTRVSKLESNLA